jgi:hypothetical protein
MVMLGVIFEQFVEASPLTVMVRAIMERIFAPAKLDALFEQTAQKQYTRELLFSVIVGLMSSVVIGMYPSVGAAYQALEKLVGVSKTALYNKLNGLEPAISQALVRYSSKELVPIIKALGEIQPSEVPGYSLRIIDGNHIGKTEHRLSVLRDEPAAPLPGQSIAVLDPQAQLIIDVFPCEDAHAQERSLFPEILATVQTKQVWMGDRNFCTRPMLLGIAQRQAYFIIREHLNLPWQALAELEQTGTSATGTIWEQPVKLTNEQGDELRYRRVVVQLNQPTRHGDEQLAILTNLPETVADASKISQLYLERWSIERMFQVVTDVFHCELKTLGYPRAALFVFCMALVAFNILSIVKAVLKSVHGREKIESVLSDFYIVEEVQGTFRGMMIAVPSSSWQPFQEIDLPELVLRLKEWATKVNLKRFSVSRRGPKKQVTKTPRDPKRPHVSTARLLKN